LYCFDRSIYYEWILFRWAFGFLAYHDDVLHKCGTAILSYRQQPESFDSFEEWDTVSQILKILQIMVLAALERMNICLS
jgi:hypothetical protein